MKEAPKVIRKEKLTDEQKYLMLSLYAEGVPIGDIASKVSRDKQETSTFIQKTLREMNSVRETNELQQGTHTAALKRVQGKNPSKFITTTFLTLVEDNAEIYAYYFSQTGDNKFALIQSGLDAGIPRNMRKTTKDYIYRIRGQYLRDIPLVKQIIKEEQEKRIKEYNIEKPQVQMELVHQIDELKEAVANDPRQRNNLLKAIEMLGRSIGAFTDRIESVETDAKSGLEILMERAKGEVYEAKDVKKEEQEAGTSREGTDLLPH